MQYLKSLVMAIALAIVFGLTGTPAMAETMEAPPQLKATHASAACAGPRYDGEIQIRGKNVGKGDGAWVIKPYAGAVLEEAILVEPGNVFTVVFGPGPGEWTPVAYDGLTGEQVGSWNTVTVAPCGTEREAETDEGDEESSEVPTPSASAKPRSSATATPSPATPSGKSPSARTSASSTPSKKAAAASPSASASPSSTATATPAVVADEQPTTGWLFSATMAPFWAIAASWILAALVGFVFGRILRPRRPKSPSLD